jgi:ornithine cyclodeaminase
VRRCARPASTGSCRRYRQRPGRRDAAERTLFKAVGTALEDLAAAELVFDAVQRESLSSCG